MTAQIPNTLVFKGKVYDIIGLSHGMLFRPEDYGFRPSMIHTACYDGFYARYRIMKTGLILDRLTIHNDDQVYPFLNGVAPRPSRQEYGCMVYDGISLPISYSGAIRLGGDFIDRYYVHLGHQKPSAFGTVIDCIFDRGLLTRSRDRSGDAAAIRGRFKQMFNDMSNGSVMEKIDQAYSLGMEIR